MALARGGARGYARGMADRTYVALLRGINVGGNNKLAMRDLAALCEGLGCAAVRTYIQSGNVVFTADAGRAGGLAAALSQAIAQAHGLKVPVVLREAGELAAVAAGNPFLAAGADAARLYVAFLAEVPTADRVARLDPARSPPDAFAVVGRDIFLHYPEGLVRSKLTNDYFDRTLGTVSTVRNWNTVLKLAAMAGG